MGSGVTKHHLGNQAFGDTNVGNLTATKVLGHFHVMILPGLAITTSQSNGVVVESTGAINFDINDLLYLFLDGLVPTEFLGSKVRIDDLKVFFTTTDVAGNVSLIEIWDIDHAAGTAIGVFSEDPEMPPGGEAGGGSYDKTVHPNLELTNQHSYFIRLTMVGLGGASICTISGVELVCSLV